MDEKGFLVNKIDSTEEQELCGEIIDASQLGLSTIQFNPIRSFELN